MNFLLHLITIFSNDEKINEFHLQKYNRNCIKKNKYVHITNYLFLKKNKRSFILNCVNKDSKPENYILEFQKKIAPFYFISNRTIISNNLTFFRIKCIYSLIEQHFYINENSKESFNLMYNKIPNILISLNAKLKNEISWVSILKYINENHNKLIFYKMLHIIIKDFSNTLKVINTVTDKDIEDFVKFGSVCNVSYIFMSFKKYCEKLLIRDDIYNILNKNDKILNIEIDYSIFTSIRYKGGLSRYNERNINLRIRHIGNNLTRTYKDSKYMVQYLYGIYRQIPNEMISSIGIFSIGTLWDEVNSKIKISKVNHISTYLKVFYNKSYDKFFSKKDKVRNVFYAARGSKLYYNKIYKYQYKMQQRSNKNVKHANRTLNDYFDTIYDDLVIGVLPYARMKLFFLTVTKESLTSNRDLIVLEADIILLTLIYELYTIVSKIKMKMLNLYI